MQQQKTIDQLEEEYGPFDDGNVIRKIDKDGIERIYDNEGNEITEEDLIETKQMYQNIENFEKTLANFGGFVDNLAFAKEENKDRVAKAIKEHQERKRKEEEKLKELEDFLIKISERINKNTEMMKEETKKLNEETKKNREQTERMNKNTKRMKKKQTKKIEEKIKKIEEETNQIKGWINEGNKEDQYIFSEEPFSEELFL
jgi:DNA anti-recombination protein RmuC